MSDRRTGKIARLPREMREVVNRMIDDGATYQQIIQVLEDHGHTGLNDQNLSNWKDGGYQDFKKEQSRLDDMRSKREFALEIVKANEGSKIHEASLQLAASQLYEVITDFDLDGLKTLLREKPENFAEVVNALTKLSKGALEMEKFKDNVAERKRAIEAQLTKAKSTGGLTADTIAEIESQLKLL